MPDSREIVSVERSAAARLFPLCCVELRAALRAMLAELGLLDFGPADSEQKISGPLVDLHLTGDAEIADLNSRFLGCPGPTNILSFPAREAPVDMPGEAPGDLARDCMEEPAERGNAAYLGSLVLSAPACLREARLYNQTPHEHCLRLLAHGLVHLLGYDHGEEMDRLVERAVGVIP